MSDNENPVENNEAAAQQNTEERPQAGFAMEKVFVKDLSFESPNSPHIFAKAWKPKVKMDLNTKHAVIEENVHEVSITVTLTVSVDDMTAYIAEVQQAGIFIVQGLEGMQYHHTIGAVCPSLLFPYLRESMDSIIVKGGFQPIMLAPVNFDAMFAQAMAKKQQQEAEAQQSEETEH